MDSDGIIDISLRRLTRLTSHLITRGGSFELSPGGVVDPISCLSLNAMAPGRVGMPVVIGGMVMDIQAEASATTEMRPGTTTPGKVRYSHGGVARNVAECMAHLGAPPLLISIVANDAAGDALLARWRKLSMPTHGIRRVRDAVTPVVVAVFDGKGEVSSAVADTIAVEEHLTPDWIRQFSAEIATAPIVMVDANLAPAALAAACELASRAGVPVWFEPVSVAKSVRATGLLHQITYVSPNEAELVAMAEALPPEVGRIDTSHRPEPAARPTPEAIPSLHPSKEPELTLSHLEPHIRRLLRAGTSHVILTIGAHGAILCSSSTLGQQHSSSSHPTVGENPRLNSGWQQPSGGSSHPMAAARETSSTCSLRCVHLPALDARVVRLSGAGDSLVAGALTALAQQQRLRVGEGAEAAVAHGVAVSRRVVESQENVPQEFALEELKGDALRVLTGSRVFTREGTRVDYLVKKS